MACIAQIDADARVDARATPSVTGSLPPTHLAAAPAPAPVKTAYILFTSYCAILIARTDVPRVISYGAISWSVLFGPPSAAAQRRSLSPAGPAQIRPSALSGLHPNVYTHRLA